MINEFWSKRYSFQNELRVERNIVGLDERILRNTVERTPIVSLEKLVEKLTSIHTFIKIFVSQTMVLDD